MRKTKKVAVKKTVKKPSRRTVGSVRKAKLPTIRKAKHKVGDRVYTYQNQNIKLPIAEVKALIDNASPINVYRLLLAVEKGKPKYGNWISEMSIYTVKKSR